MGGSATSRELNVADAKFKKSRIFKDSETMFLESALEHYGNVEAGGLSSNESNFSKRYASAMSLITLARLTPNDKALPDEIRSFLRKLKTEDLTGEKGWTWRDIFTGWGDTDQAVEDRKDLMKNFCPEDSFRRESVSKLPFATQVHSDVGSDADKWSTYEYQIHSSKNSSQRKDPEKTYLVKDLGYVYLPDVPETLIKLLPLNQQKSERLKFLSNHSPLAIIQKLHKKVQRKSVVFGKIRA